MISDSQITGDNFFPCFELFRVARSILCSWWLIDGQIRRSRTVVCSSCWPILNTGPLTWLHAVTKVCVRSNIILHGGQVMSPHLNGFFFNHWQQLLPTICPTMHCNGNEWYILLHLDQCIWWQTASFCRDHRRRLIRFFKMLHDGALGVCVSQIWPYCWTAWKVCT